MCTQHQTVYIVVCRLHVMISRGQQKKKLNTNLNECNTLHNGSGSEYFMLIKINNNK